MNPIITKLNFTYKKSDSEVWVLNTDDIPIDKNQIKDQQIVHLAPESAGGNHKHPRIEWFIGIGDLELVWLNDRGQTQIEPMHPNGQILLIQIPSLLPHAVRNVSHTHNAILFEYANAKMTSVEPVKIVWPQLKKK